MLTTNNNQSLNFYVSGSTDATVYVSPGVAQVGPYIMDFQGGSQAYAEMTDPNAPGYRYSVLCLQNANNFPDMTSVSSAPVDSTSKLQSPYVDIGVRKPIGLFLFYGDGTHLTLNSSNRIQ